MLDNIIIVLVVDYLRLLRLSSSFSMVVSTFLVHWLRDYGHIRGILVKFIIYNGSLLNHLDSGLFDQFCVKRGVLLCLVELRIGILSLIDDTALLL